MWSLNYYCRLKFQQLLALISYCTEFPFLFPAHPEFSDSCTSWKHHKFLSGTTQILVRCSTANSLKILLVSILLILESLERSTIWFLKRKNRLYILFTLKPPVIMSQACWSLLSAYQAYQLSGISQDATEPKWHLWLFRETGSLWPEVSRAIMFMKWSEMKVAQLFLTLCEPVAYIVHGILQARIFQAEVGSLFHLQGIFPTQGSNPGLLHCRLILYQLGHKGKPRILDG